MVMLFYPLLKTLVGYQLLILLLVFWIILTGLKNKFYNYSNYIKKDSAFHCTIKSSILENTNSTKVPLSFIYIYDVMKDWTVLKIEYKGNEKNNNLSVCTNSKSLTLYRQSFPSVIQCSEYNNMVHDFASWLGSNT